jgi:hypothetical protein
MQSKRVVVGVLAGLVAMPASLMGHLVRVGDHSLALKLVPALLAVILLAAAIVQQHQD